jgi:peptidoglycan L-alanyl-D-glutamate endopeptidase CwlK
MINSRDINELHPTLQPMCHRFIDDCKAEGIDIIITSTYRDYESQQWLYAQGRTRPGHKVTNARPRESYHNFRLAFDFCPIVYGKCDWTNIALFEKCGHIAEHNGLEWAGRWKRFPELAHCQLTNGITLKELRSQEENHSL